MFTGALTLQHGAPPLSLPFRLLLTPVRGAGQPRLADFATRYFHMQRFTPVDAAVAAAPDAWIVLHQGNQLNPYINYPFLTVAPLRRYNSNPNPNPNLNPSPSPSPNPNPNSNPNRRCAGTWRRRTPRAPR